VQRGGLGCPARQDEVLERLEPRLVAVDGVLERGDVRFADGRAAAGERLAQLVRIGSGELRPEREQVALDALEERVGKLLGIERACQPEGSVHLIHLTVRRDAKTVLGDAAPPNRPVSPSSPVLV